MRRRPTLALVAALTLAATPSPRAGRAAYAEEPRPAAPAGDAAGKAQKPVPKVATNEEAKAALARFKDEFKAKETDAKLDAIDGLARTNHPDVVDELAKLLAHRNAEVRSVAAQDLGLQTALPALAGKRLVPLLEAKGADPVLVTDAIDSMEMLRWRGALPHLLKCFEHEDPTVVRWALAALGDLGDVRGVDAVLELMKEAKVDEGAKWAGGEVSVDTGAEGDADQRAAEAAYAARYGDAKKKGRSSAKKSRSLGQIVFLVLKDLTGQSFASGKEAREWLEANKPAVDARKKALDEEQKAQDAAAAAAVAAAKAGK